MKIVRTVFVFLCLGLHSLLVNSVDQNKQDVVVNIETNIPSYLCERVLQNLEVGFLKFSQGVYSL